MAHTYEKELTEVSDRLQELIGYIDSTIPSDLTAVKLRVKSAMQKEQGFIHGLLGYGRTQAASVGLPPITHVMGEKIEFRQPVEVADVTPTDPEKEQFLSEVNDLYVQLPNLTNEQVGTKSKLPGGAIIVRAVAKKVGLPDYSTAKLNFAYFDKIRKEQLRIEGDAAKLREAALALEKDKLSKDDLDGE